MDASFLDPKLFDPASIDPETAAYIQQRRGHASSSPSRAELVKRDRARPRDHTLPPGCHVRTAPGAAGDVPLLVYAPDSPRGVYLYIHGGGYVMQSAWDSWPNLVDRGKALRMAVISVEYRLAPEYPYPAALDDCEAAALWLAEHAKAEFSTDRLLIGGGSAGASLSVVTLLRMRDRHDFRGFLAANLVFGGYNMSLMPSSRLGGETLWPPRSHRAWIADAYASGMDLRDPELSPLYADLFGLPRALFTVGTLDALLDDSLFMYARWVAAGDQAELAIYPGGGHGFVKAPIPIAREANARIAAFLGAALD